MNRRVCLLSGFLILTALLYATAVLSPDSSVLAPEDASVPDTRDPDSGIQNRQRQDDEGKREVSSVHQTLRSILPNLTEPQIDWLAREYGNTAVNVANEHGRQGADVILVLGQQGIAVMREQPDTFREISSRLGGATAAVFLAFMHKHFREIAELGGLPQFLERVEKLPQRARQLAQKYPQMLPFLVLSPENATAALDQYPDICLLCFPAVDLQKGADSITKMAEMIVRHGPRARRWVNSRGIDGLFLADSFPMFLDKIPPMELPVLLAILSSNQDDIGELVASGKEHDVWFALERLTEEDDSLPIEPSMPDAARRGDWFNLACVDSHTIRFLMQWGTDGFRTLTAIWPETGSSGVTLPSLLFDGYSYPDSNPRLLENAWQALQHTDEERGAFRMLVLMTQRPGQEAQTLHPRSQRFRQLLSRLDHRVVPYLLEAEAVGNLTESRYWQVETRGKMTLDEWDEPSSLLVEFLPGYDAVRLGWLLAHGYPPTQGEVLFAGVDVAFTVWDVATLGAGKAASTTLKTGIKTSAKEAAEEGTQQVVKSMASQAAKGEVKDLTTRTTAALYARLAASPKVAMDVSAKKLYRDFSVAARMATQGAAKRRISLKLVKYAVTEWARNVAAAEAIQEIAEQGAQTENAIWAEKTTEVLLYLNSTLETPLGGGREHSRTTQADS